MKKTSILGLILLSPFTFTHAEVDSQQIWKNFSGQTTCEEKKCAYDVPAKPLSLVLDYYQQNKHLIQNDKYIGVVDFSLHSSSNRFWIIDLNDGETYSFPVTHGINSEGRSGYADKFSNVVGSEMSSLGFYLTDMETYFGKFGESLRLTGLSKTNSNVRKRAVVLHSADFASDSLIEKTGKLGNSQGCPAFDKKRLRKVLDSLKGRSLILGYHSQLIVQ